MIFASNRREFFFARKTQMPHSLLWLAAVQIVKRIKNLPGPAPKGRFISTEAVESIIGQVREPQETSGEFNIRGDPALG